MTTVCFIHSTGTTPMMWASMPVERLTGATALLPSNLGYPPNEAMARGTPFLLEQEVEHLWAQLPPAGPVHLVAHSYGGLVAWKLAPRLGQRLASLLLFEPVHFGSLARSRHADPAAIQEAVSFGGHPTFLTDENLGGGEAWLEGFIDYWNRPGSWARLPEPMKDFSRELGWKMFQEVRWVFRDETPFEAYATKAPLTLVKGGRSPKASRAMVDELARVNPHATVTELEKAGHMAPLTHAAAASEVLLAHWARHGA
jgi:pimeloyl-ACP methyl ester carboxylesterase